MRKAIILIFVFLLIPLNVISQEIVVTSSYQPVADLKNGSEINYTILDRMMLHNSSALFDIGNKRIRTNYESRCRYIGNNDVPSCWTQFTNGAGGTITIDTTGQLAGGRNAINMYDQNDDGAKSGIKLNVAGPGGETLNGVIIAIFRENYTTHTAFDNEITIGNVLNQPASTNNLIMLTSGNDKDFLWAGEDGTAYNLGSGVSRANTAGGVSPGNPILLYMNSSGKQFLSNLSDASSQTIIPTLTGTTLIGLETDGRAGGVRMFSNYIYAFNTTPNINLSAREFKWKVNTSAAQTGLNIAWLGEIGANFNTSLTCNNGTDWVNGTANINGTDITCKNSQSSQDFIIQIWLANETVWVNTPLIREVAVDATPPSINYYNLTTDSGCENWVTNKSNPCSTTSVVPTVQFNTNEEAWCAIAGGIDNSSLHRNYTAMGVERNCTGSAAGEGTKSHFCTLTNTNELFYENSYLFISCKDSSNNTNSNSTSGPLKLSITNLETIGRNAIGIGVHDALISGYTNYTDLQIYVRNLSNNQAKGTFDRAAKKGSKMWAFNRIGSTESYSTVFNLTPVLYVLELANTTNSSITNLVGRMINATK